MINCRIISFCFSISSAFCLSPFFLPDFLPSFLFSGRKSERTSFSTKDNFDMVLSDLYCSYLTLCMHTLEYESSSILVTSDVPNTWFVSISSRIFKRFWAVDPLYFTSLSKDSKTLLLLLILNRYFFSSNVTFFGTNRYFLPQL